MRLSFRALTLLGILVVVLHNAEEALAMPSWLATRAPSLVDRFRLPRELIPTMDHLYVALVLVTVFPALIFLAGAWSSAGSLVLYGCVAINAALFLNALNHMLLAALLWSYTPGVVTAAAVNLPYTTAFFRRCLADRLVDGANFKRALFAGAVLYPVIFGVLVPRHHW